MAARMCDPCGKRLYSEKRAVHAALKSSRFFGRPFRLYPCPEGGNWYHVTSR